MKKCLAAALAATLAMPAMAFHEYAEVSVWGGELTGTVMNDGDHQGQLMMFVNQTDGVPAVVDVKQRAPYHLHLNVGETTALTYQVNEQGDVCEFHFRNNGSKYYPGGPESVAITAFSSNWWNVECDVDQVGNLRMASFNWEFEYDEYDWNEDCWFEEALCHSDDAADTDPQPAG